MEATKSKAKVFWYAIIITEDSRFEQILVGDTKKDLSRNLNDLSDEYLEKGLEPFVIKAILKGKQVDFKKVARLEFWCVTLSTYFLLLN